VVMPYGNVIEVNWEHPLNTSLPNVDTLSGIFMVVIEVFLNALFWIVVILCAKYIVINEKKKNVLVIYFF
jgi:hypothetical protein